MYTVILISCLFVDNIIGRVSSGEFDPGWTRIQHIHHLISKVSNMNDNRENTNKIKRDLY